MSPPSQQPLSLGEILNRTFSLYSSNFFLFFGISAIPQFLAFTAGLLLGYVGRGLAGPDGSSDLRIALGYRGLAMLAVVLLLATSVAYLFMQGGSFLAVSEIYAGRPTTIEASFRPLYLRFGSLLGAVTLCVLAIAAGTLLAIVPGIYVLCRLPVTIPASLLERRGPRGSLARSFELTRDFAGRAFVILVLAVVLNYAVTAVVAWPIRWLTTDPATQNNWGIVSSLWTVVASMLTSPVPLIAASVFYYDLRVRKEGFETQVETAPPVD